MSAPYEELGEQRPSSGRWLPESTSREATPSEGVERGLQRPPRWLRRAHHPLPTPPSAHSLALLAARCQESGEPWIAWQDGPRRYLAGGALETWSFPPRSAFQEAARLCSSLRERIVVAPEAAQALRDLPLFWHGFAFGAGEWTPAGTPAGTGSWPGGETRLPAWLLYASEDEGSLARGGLVVHAWAAPGDDPGEVQSELNDRLRDLLRTPEPSASSALAPHPEQRLSPSPLRLVDDPAEAERFQARVASAAAALGDLQGGGKVVLSRRAAAISQTEFDAPATWLALCEGPGVRAFAWSRGPEGQLVGASPELLVRLRGDRVESEALAGTAPLAEAPWLEEDPKNAAEHELVAEAVSALLNERCGSVTRGPRGLRRLRDLVHLQTPLAAARRPEHDLLELAGALHPTPALGGSPRSFALPWLAGEERGWFGAPLGFSDQGGGGELLVTIRSALLRGGRAELFAGAGVLAESDPAAEWRETQLKLHAASGALRVHRGPS